MLNILESLNDITKTEEDGIVVDSLVLAEGQSPSDFRDDDDGYYETDHDQRKMQLILTDPVHTVILKNYLQSQVSSIIFIFIFPIIIINRSSSSDPLLDMCSHVCCPKVPVCTACFQFYEISRYCLIILFVDVPSFESVFSGSLF